MARHDWQIVLPASRVEAAKRDPRLGPLLAVARAANAITIARGPLLVHWAHASPKVVRERFSALFYAAAVLAEALKTSERLEKHFAGVAQYDEGFGKLLTDHAVATFRAKTLKRFRDKGTFHFDSGFFRAAASHWPTDNIVLASLRSTRIGDIYLNAPDDLLFMHVLGPFSTDSAMVSAFSDFADQTIDVMNRFLQATHSLLPGALRRLGATRRRAV